MKNLTLHNLKEYSKIAGIYKISINDKIYIGSSKNLKHRLHTHLKTMRYKTHHNKTMQNLFNKYGEKSVFFEVLEIIADFNQLIVREKHYIDTLNPYINHILDPVQIIRDEIYRKRLSESQKEYYKYNDPINLKTVYQYDLQGNYLKEYKSITLAAKETSQEVSAISSVCRNQSYTANGYRWSFEKLGKLPEIKKKYKVIPIEQLDLNNNLIKEWESKSIAQKELKISNIARAIKYNRTAGGYKWQYKS